jgi:diguanylate cyclase (GGDEF)-like protein
MSTVFCFLLEKKHMNTISNLTLYVEVMDILPTPVLIKDNGLRYIFINKAFERLFQVDRENIIGELDKDVFAQRQVAQCSSGDRRVLATGEIDEAYETVFDQNSQPREVITRKSRLILENGETYLVGTIHDITEVSVMNRQLVSSQTKLKYQSDKLEVMANTDPLTGCLNRRSLDEKLPKLFKDQDFNGGVLILDIDHFKIINDTHGHNVGDLVLKRMVEEITKIAPPKYELVRMGGEEFLLACPGIMPIELDQLAEKIRSTIEQFEIIANEVSLSITVSIGTSHTQAIHEWNLDKLIQFADKALYQAKESGRNKVVRAQ